MISAIFGSLGGQAAPASDGVFPGFETRPIPQDYDIRRSALQGGEFESVRVLVFPHIGQYSTPQGRESVLSEITLSSEGSCQVGSTSGTSLTSVLKFRAKDLTVPVSVVCEKPVTVVREKGLPSYTYEGSFEVRAARGSDDVPYVQVINVISFEEYLKGVVPAEMPSQWPMEALKAQSIAARTYGLFEVYAAREATPGQPYDIDDTVFYQAYLGLSGASDRANAALAATRGQLMTYDGALIKAYFSSDSGGYTEDSVSVWNNALPYCVAKEEIYDLTLVKSDWKFSSTLSDIHSMLVKAGLAAGNNPVVSLEVRDNDRTDSGRVGRIRVYFKDKQSLVMQGENFRHLMKMRSNLHGFTIQANGAVAFEGRGYGHGVGMNQYGAKVLAESKNWTAPQILKFYYTGIEIETW